MRRSHVCMVGAWIAKGAGSLGQGEIALLAATVVVVGVQIFCASFVLSVLGAPVRRGDHASAAREALDTSYAAMTADDAIPR